MPEVYGENSLKYESTAKKKSFIEKYNIDFTDLIASVTHEDEMQDYSDIYLEQQNLEWNNTEQLINSLENLKLVLFTRKTFGGVPKLKGRFHSIHQTCQQLNITSRFVVTPARSYSNKKLREWKIALNKL